MNVITGRCNLHRAETKYVTRTLAKRKCKNDATGIIICREARIGSVSEVNVTKAYQNLKNSFKMAGEEISQEMNRELDNLRNTIETLTTNASSNALKNQEATRI